VEDAEGWERNVTPMREMRNAYRILVRKPEGKRTLGTLGGIWEANIKINYK
jgi:hypothetical protein